MNDYKDKQIKLLVISIKILVDLWFRGKNIYLWYKIYNYDITAINNDRPRVKRVGAKLILALMPGNWL